MAKHLNAIALALLHLPFQSRAFNMRTGNFERHSVQLKLYCDQGLRLRMIGGTDINGKLASFRRLNRMDDAICDRNRCHQIFRPNSKSFSTKMTANDVFNVQQDWQDLRRSIQAIEPKYRSRFLPNECCFALGH